MGKRKKLSKRQLAVLEDLFSGELSEQAILHKHKLSRELYNEWLADEVFVEQLDRRIASAYRQSAALIARYAPLAAAKLVQLTESDKEETARKACLDIISRCSIPDTRYSSGIERRASRIEEPLSEQTASRLLAALAEQSSSKTA